VRTLNRARVLQGRVEPLPELPQVTESLVDLDEMLGTVLNYVDDVIADNVSPDNSIGRSLLKIIQAVPRMEPEDGEARMNSNTKVNNYNICNLNKFYTYFGFRNTVTNFFFTLIQDLLMSMYLGELTKVQVQLNEKLLMTSHLVGVPPQQQ